MKPQPPSTLYPGFERPVPPARALAEARPDPSVLPPVERAKSQGAARVFLVLALGRSGSTPCGNSCPL